MNLDLKKIREELVDHGHLGTIYVPTSITAITAILDRCEAAEAYREKAVLIVHANRLINAAYESSAREAEKWLNRPRCKQTSIDIAKAIRALSKP